MKLRQAYDAFHEPRLTANAWRIVMNIDFDPCRTEQWVHSANEAVDKAKAGQIATVLYQAIIVCSEYVEALWSTGATVRLPNGWSPRRVATAMVMNLPGG